MGNGTSKKSPALPASKPTKKPAAKAGTAPKTADVATASSSAAKRSSSSSTTSALSDVYERITVSMDPEPGNIWDRYEKVKHLASGSTCQVWAIRSKTPTSIVNTADTKDGVGTSTSTATATSSSARQYALKIISKKDVTDVIIRELRNEVRILRSLDHPNILRVYAWYEDADNLYMVMEFLSGGDLLSGHGSRLPLSETEAARVLTKALSAVAYLHKRGVVHRDLKPENIVYDFPGGEPKIIDFGLSKEQITREAIMECVVGTLLSMSPEVLKGKYDYKADIWSMGTIAYTLLSGKRPFSGANNREIAAAIVDNKPAKMEGPAWEHVSADAKEFTKLLMTYNPATRPDAKKALAHPWLRRLYSPQSQRLTTDAMRRVHNALLTASTSSSFDKLVAMVVAYETPSEALDEYRQAFRALDPANTGSIKYFQFRSVLAKNKCNLSESEMKQIFEGMDIDSDGTVKYTEFLALVLLAQGRFEDNQIAAAFHRLDVDQSGTITKADLCRFLGKQCCTVNCDQIIKSVLDKYDANHDGAISLSEFMQAFGAERSDVLDDACCAVLGAKEPSATSCKKNACGCS